VTFEVPGDEIVIRIERALFWSPPEGISSPLNLLVAVEGPHFNERYKHCPFIFPLGPISSHLPTLIAAPTGLRLHREPLF